MSDFDVMDQIQRDIMLDYQWKLMVEITGSEEFSAKVMCATPQWGVPRQARSLLDALLADQEDTDDR